MFRRLVVVVVLAIGACPVGAHAAPRAQTRRAAALARWEARGTWFARHLHDADVAAVTSVGDDARLYRADDLDGDGANDLVDLRSHLTYDSSTEMFSTAARLEARRGRDGKALWSVTLGSSSYVFVLRAKIGTAGKAGILVVQETARDVDATAGYGVAYTLALTAIDGTGKQAWTQTFGGLNAGTDVGASYGTPFVDGLLDGTATGGSGVLVQSTNLTDAPVGLGSLEGSGTQLVLVDGATGAPRPFGPPIAATGWAEAAPVPDLDGDHFGDVALTTAAGDTTRLLALNGVTGTPLWAAALPASVDSYPYAVGDVTGDGVADIATSHASWSGNPVGGADLGYRTSLVDGKTGAVQWSKTGEDVWPIGHGLVAVVASGKGQLQPYGVAVTAYDAAGRVRWTMHRAAFSWPGYTSDAGAGPVGDVQADGYADLGYWVETYDGRSGVVLYYNAGTLDGRTGRVLPDPVYNYFEPGVSFDGHGDDAYTRSVAHGALSVTAWRADAGRALWRTSVVASGMVWRSLAYSLDHDKCAEIAITMVSGSTRTSYVFAGGTGLPLWSLARTGDGAGAIGHPKVTKHSRLAKTC